MAEGHAGRASQGHAECDQALSQPQGAPGPGGGHGGQACGADAAQAAAMRAEKLPHAERSYHADVGPRKISTGAPVVTVEAPGGKPADGTVPQELGRGDTHRQLGGGLVQRPGLQGQRGASREHA